MDPVESTERSLRAFRTAAGLANRIGQRNDQSVPERTLLGNAAETQVEEADVPVMRV